MQLTLLSVLMVMAQLASDFCTAITGKMSRTGGSPQVTLLHYWFLVGHILVVGVLSIPEYSQFMFLNN